MIMLLFKPIKSEKVIHVTFNVYSFFLISSWKCHLQPHNDIDKWSMQSMTENFVAYWLLIDYPLIIGNNQWFNQQITHWLTIDYTLMSLMRYAWVDINTLGKTSYTTTKWLSFITTLTVTKSLAGVAWQVVPVHHKLYRLKVKGRSPSFW